MNKPSNNSSMNRRRFLASTGAALALPLIVPSTVLGRGGRSAPSERITLASIGCGGMGNGNTDDFLGKANCQVVAACDVDKNHLDAMVKKVNDHYKNGDCKGYHDFRELLPRTDIDAVMLALPDHWHGIVAVAAAGHQKDIYGEKPLARTDYRAAGHRSSCPNEQTHLANRFVAAFTKQFSQGRRNRTEWVDRQN